MKNIGVGMKLGIRANLNILRDGKRIPVLKNQRNLILDTGMQDIGQRGTEQFQTYCHWGDDNTGNSTDSGATTMTQSGTTVTASAGFFSAGMVGQLLKPDAGGSETYITTYNSPTEVVVDVSQTVAATEFTVWAVDQTTLQNEVQRTSSTQGTNNETLSGGVFSINRTHIFSAVGSAQTVREVGWGHGNDTTVGSRVVLGSPVSLSSGDQLEVESHFEIVQSPQTAASTDPTGDEGDFSMQTQIEGVGLAAYDNVWYGLEPSALGELYILTSAPAFNTYGTARNVNSITHSEHSFDSESSDPGAPPWEKTFTWNLSTSEANTTIYGFGVGQDALGSNQVGLRCNLDTPQAKSSLQTLDIVVTVSWDRNLTN